MKTQMDHRVRVVALANLEAMCARVSGMCHRFKVSKVTRSRVHVEYSNPDEYGYERPMTAVYPCYPSGKATCGTTQEEMDENPIVVLDMLRVLNDSHDGEGWQCFEQLRDCPQLWRDPRTGVWATSAEAEMTLARAKEKPSDPRPDPCPECGKDRSTMEPMIKAFHPGAC